jgi:mutator protein MutT
MIRVVAACIQNQHGEYLLTRRPSGKVRAGEWEFPGGKMHSGESTHQALVRELREELGLEVLASEPLHSFSHHYPDLDIELNLLRVLRWQHEPQALEQQQLRWVGVEAMRYAVGCRCPYRRRVAATAVAVHYPEHGLGGCSTGTACHGAQGDHAGRRIGVFPPATAGAGQAGAATGANSA